LLPHALLLTHASEQPRSGPTCRQPRDRFRLEAAAKPSAAVDRDEERCFRDGSAATVLSMINDRRDDMTLAELVEELELSYPEKVASFESLPGCDGRRRRR